MTVKELYDALSEKISPSLSEPWDHDGFSVCPDPSKEARRVLFALDLSDAVARYAVKTHADVIVTHHPLIFSPLYALTPEEPIARRTLYLVRKGISAMSFHTRFDRLSGGVNDTLAQKLRLSDVAALGEGEASLGRIGTLPNEMSLADFADYVKIALGVPYVTALDAHRSVRRVAVVGGEGKDFIAAATAAGADTYLSGRLGYHAMQDAAINLVEAGHYYTERAAAEALLHVVSEIDPTLECEIYTPNPLTVY